MKPFFIAVFGCLLSAVTYADTDLLPQGKDTLGALVADFDQYYGAKLKEHNIPGAAYAIVQGNKIIATAGFGVRQQGRTEPVDPYTVFRIASVSKTFAGGLSSILAAEGHFNWDDKLVDYIPGFSFKSKKYNSQLKLKHLLSQSTGVMPNAYDNLIEADVPLERILPQFSKIDPLCPPGQCYGYQNVLFSLIDQVIQKSTGKTYAEQLQERIITPLQLPTASVGLDGFFSTENRAMPHVRARGKWYPTKVAESYYHFSPAAGVNASAIDLGYWLIAQLGHNPAVLSDELLAGITAKQVKTRRDLRRKEFCNWFLVTSQEQIKERDALELKELASSLMHDDNYLIINRSLRHALENWQIEPNDPLQRLKDAMLTRQNRLKGLGDGKFKLSLEFPEVSAPEPAKQVALLVQTWDKL